MHKICSRGIARTCDKIECVLARKVIDLAKFFKDVDPKRCGMVSAEKFFTVIYIQLGHEFGVCQEEVRELADYFKKEDCRVCYTHFLKLVTPQNFSEKPFVTGLEWEDHLQVNVISPFELRHLNLILTKIAKSCRVHDVFLQPLFQDYERQSRNCGTVTIPHFRRVLYFAGITLGAKEFQLVLKRFMKHCYTVNYVAFVKDIEKIMQWFDQHGFLDCYQNILDCYPGKVIVDDVDMLPRPEVDVLEMYGIQKPCHPCMDQIKPNMKFEDLMLRIKKHIYDSSIRTREFFEKFDQHNSGFITKSQFHRGLDAIGLSGLHRLYVAPLDLKKIFTTYEDPCDCDRVAWNRFCDDVDEVFTIKLLDKQPYRVVESPQQEVKEMARPGTANWDCVPKTMKQTSQEALLRIRKIVKSQRILIETYFKGFDKKNLLHVSRCQMRRVFSSCSILLSETEIMALMARYCDDLGFNYWQLMKDIDDVQFCESKHKEIMNILEIVNAEKPKRCPASHFSIIDVFAKVKGLVTRKRINLEQFMQCRGRLQEKFLPVRKFRASFSAAGIILDDCELDILCESFKAPCTFGHVDHKAFINMINQAFYQTKLEKDPLKQPIQHLPTHDDALNFLNLNERRQVSHALQKLSRFYDDKSNMKSFFEDRKGNNDNITKQKLETVLATCYGLMDLITYEELDVLYKSFSIPAGKGRKFDYVGFMHTLTQIRKMSN